MAEYINREEVCKLCDNQKEYCGKEKCPVYKVPAHDVAEVVRCKDCDFCHYNSCNDTYRCSTHNGMSRTVEPNEYCSYGERREGE